MSTFTPVEYNGYVIKKAFDYYIITSWDRIIYDYRLFGRFETPQAAMDMIYESLKEIPQ